MKIEFSGQISTKNSAPPNLPTIKIQTIKNRHKNTFKIQEAEPSCAAGVIPRSTADITVETTPLKT